MNEASDAGMFPDTLNIENEIGTNNVRVTFACDSGETARVILDQTRLLSLIGKLHEKIERSPLTPISLDRLRPGKTIAVQGFSAKRQSDGSLRIVLMAEFEDRVVTVPFEVSPEGIKDLAKEIGMD